MPFAVNRGPVVYEQSAPQQRAPLPEQQPGLAQLLGGGLGQGIGQGFEQGLTGALRRAALQKATGMINPNASVLDQYMQVQGSTYDPAVREQLTKEYLPLAIKQGEAQAERAKEERGYQHDYNKIQMQLGKGKHSTEEMQRVQSSFNSMAKILKSGNVGVRNPFQFVGWNRKGVQDRAKFNTLGASLESIMKDMVNKGAMSKDRFQYMLSTIPKDTDTDRVILGKMEALAEEIGLDPSMLPDFDIEEESPSMQSRIDARGNPRVNTGPATPGFVRVVLNGHIGEIPEDQLAAAQQEGATLAS